MVITRRVTDSYTYIIDTLPGNQSIGVSHSSWVDPASRNQGLGSALHVERLKAAQDAGLDYLLATVNKDNTAQMKIMKKNGWKELDSFISSCTCHVVVVFGKELGAVKFSPKVQ